MTHHYLRAEIERALLIKLAAWSDVSMLADMATCRVLAVLTEFAARGGVEAREVAVLLFGADNVRVGVLLSPLPSRNPHVGMPWIVYHPDYCSSDNFTKDVLIIVPPNPTGDADG